MQAMLNLDEKDLIKILNGMVDGVITINQHGRIIMFNKTAEQMFGYKSDEVVGENVSMLMPEPDRSAHDSYLHNHVTTGVAHIIGIGRDVTALKKDGETFPMRLSVIESPAKVEGDRWFIGSCRDITLQKKQEEQLRRSMKMDAIGKLTSGLAHDYNNALGVILGFSELLALQVKDQPELQKYIKPIKQAAERAANLTTKLLSITRKRTDTAEPVIINELLEDNQQILSKTLTPQIKLLINPEDNLWPVYIDKGSLEDAILNLSINAMHAMPEGGELEFATSNIQLQFLEAQVLNIVQGDYIKLTISDTGTGMSENVLSHIFEPFYSTKGEKGTGLGLSMVYKFVTDFKGTVRVYSEPGHGSCFTIFFPRYLHEQSDSEADNLQTINEDELNGSANILIVDDELDIRELTESILHSHGYTVFSASSAKDALTILEDDAIELVISDIVMPELDGFELAHIINHTYPDIKIQLCSGFANARGKSVTNETLFKNMLHKPFQSKKLLQNIKTLLNS